MIVSHGASAIRPNLLILGGTTGAALLAEAVARRGIPATISLAGRVARPRPLAVPMRIGGFGGAQGLAAWLRAQGITHVVDATHPFAAAISRNAVAACETAGIPLIALTRPRWVAAPGDAWSHVPDIAAAVAALCRPRARVMLAVGRVHLPAFAVNLQHFYLLRLVDPPTGQLPFPDAEVIVDRGPFETESDMALLRRHGIELVVSKNSGGAAAYAKIAAARALGLPVLMIDRPAMPDRREVGDVDAVLDWIAHAGTERGVKT